MPNRTARSAKKLRIAGTSSVHEGTLIGLEGGRDLGDHVRPVNLHSVSPRRWSGPAHEPPAARS
jgi:hypothetical protein